MQQSYEPSRQPQAPGSEASEQARASEREARAARARTPRAWIYIPAAIAAVFLVVFLIALL